MKKREKNEDVCMRRQSLKKMITDFMDDVPYHWISQFFGDSISNVCDR